MCKESIQRISPVLLLLVYSITPTVHGCMYACIPSFALRMYMYTQRGEGIPCALSTHEGYHLMTSSLLVVGLAEISRSLGVESLAEMRGSPLWQTPRPTEEKTPPSLLVVSLSEMRASLCRPH